MTPMHDLFCDRNFISHIFPPTIHNLTPRVVICVGQWHTHSTETIPVHSQTLKGKTAGFMRRFSHN